MVTMAKSSETRAKNFLFTELHGNILIGMASDWYAGMEMGDVRSKTTFGESCAGADALGGGRGGFRRSKNSAGRCARKKK